MYVGLLRASNTNRLQPIGIPSYNAGGHHCSCLYNFGANVAARVCRLTDQKLRMFVCRTKIVEKILKMNYFKLYVMVLH